MKLLFTNPLAKTGATIALAMAGLLSVGAAHAVGTASGVAITNLATLTYSVGTTPQSPIGSSATGNLSGLGTPTSFVVDTKIDLLVIRDVNTFVSAVPGTNGVASFTVTNSGNSVQDYSLSAGFTGLTGTLSSTTDNFDPVSCSAYVESAVAADGYQSASDIATFIDELSAGASKTVYVVCPIALARVNGDAALVSLTATARVGGTAGGPVGGALSQSAVNTEFVLGVSSGIDIVFADIAGSDDGARDGKHSVRQIFKVETAKLTVTKTVTPVCDPLNGSTNPKNIPGSFVSYTITIANALLADTATLTTISDTLDLLKVTFDANLITGAGAPATLTSCDATSTAYQSALGSGFKVTGPVARSSFSGGPKYYTTTSSVDGVDFVSPNITVDFATVLPGTDGGYQNGHLKAGESVMVTYQVQIK